jgi:outer membrane protein assembly factor BamD
MKQVLAQSKITLGDYYFRKRSNYTAARVFYNEAITSYPDSEVANTARAKLAEVDARAAAEAPKPGEPVPQKKKKRFFFF